MKFAPVAMLAAVPERVRVEATFNACRYVAPLATYSAALVVAPVEGPEMYTVAPKSVVVWNVVAAKYAVAPVVTFALPALTLNEKYDPARIACVPEPASTPIGLDRKS